MRHDSENPRTIGARKELNAVSDGQPTGAFGQAKAIRFFLVEYDSFRGELEMKKIDINTIPELNTSVGIHGSVKQQEVAGPLCLGILVAIVMAV